MLAIPRDFTCALDRRYEPTPTCARAGRWQQHEPLVGFIPHSRGLRSLSWRAAHCSTPTDRELFTEQRQQFDWSLLQNGHVFHYDIGFQLDSAGGATGPDSINA